MFVSKPVDLRGTLFGSDYHDILLDRMETDRCLSGETGPETQKCYVDTGPMLERDFGGFRRDWMAR